MIYLIWGIWCHIMWLNLFNCCKILYVAVVQINWSTHLIFGTGILRQMSFLMKPSRLGASAESWLGWFPARKLNPSCGFLVFVWNIYLIIVVYDVYMAWLFVYLLYMMFAWHWFLFICCIWCLCGMRIWLRIII